MGISRCWLERRFGGRTGSSYFNQVLPAARRERRRRTAALEAYCWRPARVRAVAAPVPPTTHEALEPRAAPPPALVPTSRPLAPPRRFPARAFRARGRSDARRVFGLLVPSSQSANALAKSNASMLLNHSERLKLTQQEVDALRQRLGKLEGKLQVPHLTLTRGEP